MTQLLPEASYDFRLLSDSGEFLTGPSYAKYPPCTAGGPCNREYMMHQASSFMNLQFDDSCSMRFGPDEAWRCAFPAEYRVMEEISTPTLFTFFLHDANQLQSDGIEHTSVA